MVAVGAAGSVTVVAIPAAVAVRVEAAGTADADRGPRLRDRGLNLGRIPGLDVLVDEAGQEGVDIGGGGRKIALVIAGRAANRGSAMHHWRFCPRAVDALGAIAAAVLPLPPAGAVAAPQRLDCNLTSLETRTGSTTDAVAENRSITVVFDREAKALTVYPNGSALVLTNVTMSQIAMSGYVSGDVSLSIDPSSWSIVFQTYKPASANTEFGTCSPSAKPLP